MQATTQLAAIIGQNIQAARAAKNLTQHELALIVESQAFQVSRWEQGKHRPNDTMLMRLAEALGVDHVWLLTERKAAA